MNIKEALAQIAPVKPAEYVIANLADGNFDDIKGPDSSDPSLGDAQEQFKAAKSRVINAKSDLAYWGHLGDQQYWGAVVDILAAAELVGENNLPDIPPPRGIGITMDDQEYIRKFGADIYRLAEEAAESEASQ